MEMIGAGARPCLYQSGRLSILRAFRATVRTSLKLTGPRLKARWQVLRCCLFGHPQGRNPVNRPFWSPSRALVHAVPPLPPFEPLEAATGHFSLWCACMRPLQALYRQGLAVVVVIRQKIKVLLFNMLFITIGSQVRPQRVRKYLAYILCAMVGPVSMLHEVQVFKPWFLLSVFSILGVVLKPYPSIHTRCSFYTSSARRLLYLRDGGL